MLILKHYSDYCCWILFWCTFYYIGLANELHYDENTVGQIETSSRILLEKVIGIYFFQYLIHLKNHLIKYKYFIFPKNSFDRTIDEGSSTKILIIASRLFQYLLYILINLKVFQIVIFFLHTTVSFKKFASVYKILLSICRRFLFLIIKFVNFQTVYSNKKKELWQV